MNSGAANGGQREAATAHRDAIETRGTAPLSIGIDPGTTGAVAAVRGASLVSVVAIPVLGPAGDRIVDARALVDQLRHLDALYGPCRCTIERAQVMRGPGVQIGAKSSFSYGRIYGGVLACVALAGIPYKLVPPQSWRRQLPGSPKGRKETKAAIERVVRERLPGLPRLKQDHLDAIFLALLDS